MNPRAVALGGPSNQATGEVWGFSTLPDYRTLSTHFTLPSWLRLPGVREGGCSNHRLPHKTEWQASLSFSPKARPSLFSAASHCPKLSCWFLSCLPSPGQAGSTHIPDSLTYSINKQVFSSYLMPGLGQSRGLERQVKLIPAPEVQGTMSHVCIF